VGKVGRGALRQPGSEQRAEFGGNQWTCRKRRMQCVKALRAVQLQEPAEFVAGALVGRQRRVDVAHDFESGRHRRFQNTRPRSTDWRQTSATLFQTQVGR